MGLAGIFLTSMVSVWLVEPNIYILSLTLGQWGKIEVVTQFDVEEVNLEGMFEYFEG